MTTYISDLPISTHEVEREERVYEEGFNHFPLLSNLSNANVLASMQPVVVVFKSSSQGILNSSCSPSLRCDTMRNDKGSRHYHLDSVFSDDLDKKLMSCYKKANMLKKISFIMNTIKANAQYSNKGVEYDFHMAEIHNTDADEVELIRECWDIRKQTAKSLMKDWREFLNELKEVVQ